MKKLFFTLCALCLCGTMWADTTGTDIQKDATTGLYFATVTYDNATTTTVIAIIPAQNGDSYSVDNLVQNSDGTYTLPATVQADGGEEVALQGIAASAFAEALTDTSNPIHLVIPANIINLGQEAFNKCSQIEEVTVEYSATNLDEAHNTNYNSFNNCSNIKTVTLDRDISIHRNNAQYAYTCFTFCKLPSIETVYIGEHVTTLANNAFNANGTSQLSAVYCYATDHVPTLANQCFLYQAEGCTLYVYDELVETFTADKNDDKNGWGDIFSNIQGIGSAGLEEGTYKDVTTGLYFEINEDGTASIYHDEAGIYTDANLVPYSYDTEGNANAYTLPEKVSADGETYYDVTRVEASAFESSSISGHIVIPAYITAIGEKAFMNSTQITEVTYEYSATALKDESSGNNTGTESFNGCSGVTTVNLYRDVTAGHDSNLCTPFCYNTTITTVNVGPRVTSIPQYMFRNTSTKALTTINVYSATPSTLGTAPFDNLNDSYVINVPQGAEEAYASSWSSYYTEGHTGNLSNAYAVDITLSNDDGYYATYYNSKAVDIYPQGGTDYDVTSYAVSGVEVEDEEEGYLDLAEVGATVPAKTAVLVEATAEGTYTIIETTAATSASYTGTNDLYGYDTATTVTSDSNYYYYTLSHPASGGSLGFYWATSDGSATGFTSAAHKAYLMLSKSEVGTLKSISLRKGDGGGDTTGITSVEVENEAKAVKGIYTVQGVRVSNMNQPGLYIVDGKKVLVK